MDFADLYNVRPGEIDFSGVIKRLKEKGLLTEYRDFFNNPKITFEVVKKCGLFLLVGTLVLPESGKEINVSRYINKNEFNKNDHYRNTMFFQLRDFIGLEFIRRCEMVE